MKTSEQGIEFLKHWAEVGSEDQCWPFRRKNLVYSKGGRMAYGQITYKRKKWRAHRLALHLMGVTFGPKDCVCHKCDNPLCMNPSHLFVGTQADNLRDRSEKGRATGAKGIKNGSATITDEQVAEVKRLAIAGIKQRIIAQQFGISQPLVSTIKHGKTRNVSYENK